MRSAVVVGAGLVGLASAYRLLERQPGMAVTVLDKESSVAAHQSGHNSGVVHRGIYYRPGSRKADLCRRGSVELLQFCEEHAIGVVECGKLIVAASRDELPGLAELHRRGLGNGVPDLELIGPQQLAEIEPHCVGLQALHSPRTAIVDFGAVAQALAAEVRARGGVVQLGAEVQHIRERGAEVVVSTTTGDLAGEVLIACAGLQSDRLAAEAGVARPLGMRIIPFRGDYYLLRSERRDLCRSLIYPVPDPRFPFLGVHFTRRPDGSVWLGPNAVLAFDREAYDHRGVAPRDLAALLAFSGFWAMGLRHWRMGLDEMLRSSSRSRFLAALRRYVPELELGDLEPGPAGIRAQAVTSRGRIVDDFVFARSARQLHVLNAPSPAATSALAIASVIAERALASAPSAARG